jgi:hypothetical protein
MIVSIAGGDRSGLDGEPCKKYDELSKVSRSRRI